MDRRPSFDRRTSFDPAPKSPATDIRPQPSMPGEEKIPRMTSVAPCIFVPLETDITQPREPARNRVERLERRITSIEAQRPGVLENIVYMAERERLAILQQGREIEAAIGNPAGPAPSLPPDEVDWLMGNLAAPAPKDKDLNIKHDGDIQEILSRHAVLPQEMTDRESVTMELVTTVREARKNIAGYSYEVDKRVKYYKELLETEKKRLEEAGKRPEERQNAP